MGFRIIAVGLALVVLVGAYVGFTLTQPAQDGILEGIPGDENCSSCTIDLNTLSGQAVDSEISDGAATPNASEDAIVTPNGVVSDSDTSDVTGNDIASDDSSENSSQNDTNTSDSSVTSGILDPVLTLFWGEGCPRCAEEKEFLDGIEDAYPGLQIVKYEVKENKTNLALLKQWCSEWDMDCSTLPVTFIGGKAFANFKNSDDELIYNSGVRAYVGYRNQIENAIREVLGLEPEEITDWREGVSLSIRTDNVTYYEKEPINITVLINSRQFVNDCQVFVKGLKGSKGYYVDSDKWANLKKGTTEVLFEEVAPNCFGCGGFEPGEYEIKAWLKKDGEIIDEAVMTVGIDG